MKPYYSSKFFYTIKKCALEETPIASLQPFTYNAFEEHKSVNI